MEDELISYIALGSNLGDSRRLILEALTGLSRWSVCPVSHSSLWRTDPVDCPPGSAPFINAVAGIRPMPGWTPERMLEVLQQMERDFGRTPKRRINEARPLDLDILTWGDTVRTSPALTLPHPRAHQRRFVLAPLAEIAPDLVLPGQKQTVHALLRELTDRGKCELVESLG